MQKICIVIPCYNEEKRLPKQAFLSYIKENTAVDFCFVNDGSTDNTIAVLEDIKAACGASVHVLDMKVNSGKAEAVRAGVMHCHAMGTYDMVGFFDADLATPLSEIERLLEQMHKDKNYCFSFCSRLKRIGAHVERSALRHYLGRIFSTFSSIILKMPVYDTQCGAKLFKSSIIEVTFNRSFISKWLFDIEIFMRLRNHFGLKKAVGMMVEVPVLEWIEKGGSKLPFLYMLKVPLELLKIYAIYRQPKSL